MDEAPVIESADGENVVRMTLSAYAALVDEIDVLTSQRAAERIADGRETPIPAEHVEAYIEAPTPLAFWRSYRGLDIEELATSLGFEAPRLAEIEAGHAPLDLVSASRLARALSIATDDLVPLTAAP